MVFPPVILGRDLAPRPGMLVVDFARRLIIGAGPCARLSPLQLRLATCLIMRRGGMVMPDELVDHLWGDRADGGPADTNRVITHLLFRLRGKCPGLRFVAAHSHYRAEIAPARLAA